MYYAVQCMGCKHVGHPFTCTRLSRVQLCEYCPFLQGKKRTLRRWTQTPWIYLMTWTLSRIMEGELPLNHHSDIH